MKVFVVIPAYNEEKIIKKVIFEVQRFCTDIIVVDDGSKDKTFEIAKACNVLVLRHTINRGQGAALKTGIDFALLNKADIIVTFDADGQMSAADIPKLIDPIVKKQADIVLGSRFLQNKTNIPGLRRVVLKMALIFTRFTTGLKLTDSHNGFRAMTASCAKSIEIRQDKMAHASEILNEIARKKLKYVEVPVEINYTEYSLKKGQKLSGAIKILVDLFLGKFQ